MIVDRLGARSGTYGILGKRDAFQLQVLLMTSVSHTVFLTSLGCTAPCRRKVEVGVSVQDKNVLTHSHNQVGV